MSATLCEPDLLGIETDEATEAIWGEENDRSIVAREVDGADDVPDERWSTGELTGDLTARAIAEMNHIEQSDKWVTRHHWYLGRTLNAGRGRFKRVEWGNWLKQCKTTKYVARDARKLAKLYATPEGLGDLSVVEALRRAKVGAPDPETSRLLRNLEARFRNAVKAAGAAAEKVETGGERAALGKSIEQTVTALSALRGACARGESL